MGIILPQLIYGGKKISILYHYFPWSLLHGASLPTYEWKCQVRIIIILSLIPTP